MLQFLLFFCLLSLTFAADKYSSFEELQKNEKENVDYKIRLTDKKSPITIFAIHGGKIEPSTSELLDLMSSEFNHYAFEGIKEGDNFDLHLTSTHFDEPQAVALATKSQDCLSFHGYIGKETRKTFCVGGANVVLAQEITKALQNFSQDYDVVFPCLAYPGAHIKNIVNRCEHGGVQIEMNTPLRDIILSQPSFRQNLAKTLSDIIKNQKK